jgi:mannose-6-phosphate isomerase-like protein (cupin superfamily)
VKGGLVLPGLDTEPVERGGGVRTWHLVTAERGATEFLTGITEFDPGAALAPHFHNCQESVTVLEGRAFFEADGETCELEPTAATLVPTGTVHRFRNPGPGRLRILFVYGSVNATRTVVA